MNFCQMVPSGFMTFLHLGARLAATFYLIYDIRPSSSRTIMSSLDTLTAKLIKVSRYLVNYRIRQTFNSELCRSKNVRSYPTVKFHGKDDKNNDVIVDYDGEHHWEEVEEWFHDLKNPSVFKLDSKTFYEKVVGRPDGEIWFVDFAANWCRPCQMMIPEFKGAAKRVLGKINFGYVECTEHQSICNGFSVRSYPTILLFQPKTPQDIGKSLHRI